MNGTNVRIGMMVIVLASPAALAQPDDAEVQLRGDRNEFTRLVHQRNDLYAQLALVDEQAQGGVTWSVVATASASGVQPFTPKKKAEFNTLLYKRTKLYGQLTGLDKQASDLIKSGDNPLVVHAQQVSVQDHLDLVELRLAIVATRHGIAVPPLPGRDRMPDGSLVAVEDDSARNLEQAFSRGRDRAVKHLRDDAEQFMTSLDFWAFLND